MNHINIVELKYSALRFIFFNMPKSIHSTQPLACYNTMKTISLVSNHWLDVESTKVDYSHQLRICDPEQ